MHITIELSDSDTERLLCYADDFECAYPSEAQRQAHQRDIYQVVTYRAALQAREAQKGNSDLRELPIG